MHIRSLRENKSHNTSTKRMNFVVVLTIRKNTYSKRFWIFERIIVNTNLFHSIQKEKKREKEKKKVRLSSVWGWIEQGPERQISMQKPYSKCTKEPSD